MYAIRSYYGIQVGNEEIASEALGSIEKRSELGRVIGATNLVKEFERTIFRELDMLVEAGNIERFAQGFADIV